MSKKLLTSLKHALSSADTAVEGQYGYDSTRKAMQYHDGVRKRLASTVGYMPFAYPPGFGGKASVTTSATVPANGGAIQIPIMLPGHMLLQSVTYRDNSTATARGPIEFAIYEDRRGDSNTADLVSGAVGSLASYTPSAASNRVIAVTSPPAYLAPGNYWLLMKNNHASSAWQLALEALGTMNPTTWRSKTLTTSAFGATLDLVTSWTDIVNAPGVRLNGRVFGQTAAF